MEGLEEMRHFHQTSPEHDEHPAVWAMFSAATWESPKRPLHPAEPPRMAPSRFRRWKKGGHLRNPTSCLNVFFSKSWTPFRVGM